MIWISSLLPALVLLGIWLRHRFLAFRGQDPRSYADLAPGFDLHKHLNGPIRCDGLIFGPTGRVVSRFVADMEGEWNGDRGVLREAFRYDSGATQDREWRLTLGEGGAIRAEADDVIGAGEGRVCGPAVQMRYRIKLPEDAGGHTLDTVDWMYLTSDGVIMNRSQFRKFGILVAELVATMRPEGGK